MRVEVILSRLVHHFSPVTCRRMELYRLKPFTSWFTMAKAKCQDMAKSVLHGYVAQSIAYYPSTRVLCDSATCEHAIITAGMLLQICCHACVHDAQSFVGNCRSYLSVK